MSVFEALYLMIAFATLLMAVISYLDRNNKHR